MSLDTHREASPEEFAVMVGWGAELFSIKMREEVYLFVHKRENTEKLV